MHEQSAALQAQGVGAWVVRRWEGKGWGRVAQDVQSVECGCPGKLSS
jgi:hypothetical protein